jgi:hypothetical protein
MSGELRRQVSVILWIVECQDVNGVVDFHQWSILSLSISLLLLAIITRIHLLRHDLNVSKLSTVLNIATPILSR